MTTSDISTSGTRVSLNNVELWQQFYPRNEMVVTRAGRKLFPDLEVTIEGLDQDALYTVHFHLERINNIQYHFNKNSGQWEDAGLDENTPMVMKVQHNRGGLNGSDWMKTPVSFSHVYITNTESQQKQRKIDLIRVSSMHRYQPVITVKRVGDGYEEEFRLTMTEFVVVTAYQVTQGHPPTYTASQQYGRPQPFTPAQFANSVGIQPEIEGYGTLTWLSARAGVMITPDGKTISFQEKEFCQKSIADLRTVLRVGLMLNFRATLSDLTSKQYVATSVLPIVGPQADAIFKDAHEIDLDPSLAESTHQSQRYSKILDLQTYPVVLESFSMKLISSLSLSSMYIEDGWRENKDCIEYVGERLEDLEVFIKNRAHIFEISEDEVSLMNPAVHNAVVQLASFLLRRGGVTSINDLYEFFYSHTEQWIREYIGRFYFDFTAFLKTQPFAFAVFENFVSARRNFPDFDYLGFIQTYFPAMVGSEKRHEDEHYYHQPSHHNEMGMYQQSMVMAHQSSYTPAESVARHSLSSYTPRGSSSTSSQRSGSIFGHSMEPHRQNVLTNTQMQPEPPLNYSDNFPGNSSTSEFTSSIFMDPVRREDQSLPNELQWSYNDNGGHTLLVNQEFPPFDPNQEFGAAPIPDSADFQFDDLSSYQAMSEAGPNGAEIGGQKQTVKDYTESMSLQNSHPSAPPEKTKSPVMTRPSSDRSYRDDWQLRRRDRSRRSYSDDSNSDRSRSPHERSKRNRSRDRSHRSRSHYRRNKRSRNHKRRSDSSQSDSDRSRSRSRHSRSQRSRNHKRRSDSSQSDSDRSRSRSRHSRSQRSRNHKRRSDSSHSDSDRSRSRRSHHSRSKSNRCPVHKKTSHSSHSKRDRSRSRYDRSKEKRPPSPKNYLPSDACEPLYREIANILKNKPNVGYTRKYVLTKNDIPNIAAFILPLEKRFNVTRGSGQTIISLDEARDIQVSYEEVKQHFGHIKKFFLMKLSISEKVKKNPNGSPDDFIDSPFEHIFDEIDRLIYINAVSGRSMNFVLPRGQISSPLDFMKPLEKRFKVVKQNDKNSQRIGQNIKDNYRKCITLEGWQQIHPIRQRSLSPLIDYVEQPGQSNTDVLTEKQTNRAIDLRYENKEFRKKLEQGYSNNQLVKTKKEEFTDDKKKKLQIMKW
ncbi:unnamed protein product [Caenorhabditis brenneri]